jgi:microcystin degradation protein MlrC
MAISEGNFVFEGPMFTGLPGTTGKSVCLRVDGIDIMIVSERMQMLDQNIFRIVGIEPKEKAIVAVKSMQHFKGAFGPIATQIIVTDAGGLSSPDLSRRTYSRLRRPVFPLDALPDRQQ